MSETAKSPSDKFAPLSPVYLEEPAPTLKAIQRDEPVFYHEPLGCWVITKYDDVRQAFLDPATFSSQATSFLRPPEDLAPLVSDLSRDRIIIMLDPPEHAKHRNAMAKRFGSAAINKLEGFIASAANALIDQFAPAGKADLMNSFCVPLTMETIIHVLGIPSERRADYRQWSEDFFALLAPRHSHAQGGGNGMSESDLRERWARLGEASTYVKSYIAELRETPSDCIVSDMLKARTVDGQPALDDGDIVGHILSLIGAGHDTTANAIAHIVHYLSQDPVQQRAILNDPSLIPLAVEEGLRMRGSVPGLMRITTRDVELRGVRIPANSLVYLIVAGTGHDEEVFADSLRFDVRRANAGRHLAFGIGRHTCIGSALARLQAGVAIRELYRRLPDLAEVPGYQRSYMPLMTVTGLTGLDVRWTPPRC